MYIIRDTGEPDRSTGTGDRREAETLLAEYIAEKHRRRRQGFANEPAELTIAEALAFYGEQHAPTTADPARIGYAIANLLDFWGDLRVTAVKGETCRRYVAFRQARPVIRGAEAGKVPAISTIRRELGTLNAALEFCRAEGVLTYAPPVTLPPKPEGRPRWLTVEEVAFILRACRQTAPHLARFVLISLYTGTRKQAALSLGWEPHPAGGFIDTDRGILYRKSADAFETNKRRRPVRLPAKLLGHCRRWKADGGRFVVSWNGQGVGSIKTAWNATRRRAEALAAAAGRPVDLSDVTPHTLKHTAVTWAMQRGMRLEDAASYFSTTVEELQRTYWHHHPDFQAAAAATMDRRQTP